MNPLAQSKTTILPLLISLALVISGCQTSRSLHIVRSTSAISPMVVPEVATGRFRFHVVVKNGGTTDSPTAFLRVQTAYHPNPYGDYDPNPGGTCWTETSKFYQIPALKPGETSDYSSRIEDLGATAAADINPPGFNPPASWCNTCKKGECGGLIYFKLHKASHTPFIHTVRKSYRSFYVGAQMTGPNTWLQTVWDAVTGINEVKDWSK
jgi:hypothetical protein